MPTKIIEIIKKHTDVTDFRENSCLQMDLDMDSFDIIQMVEELEKTFNITVSHENLTGFVTVGDVIKYVKTASNVI